VVLKIFLLLSKGQFRRKLEREVAISYHLKKGGVIMPKFKIVTALFLCVGILCVFCSCQTPAGRSAGQVVDDGTITTKVKTKLFDDPLVSGFAISVKTFQGEVTLTGAVDSKKAKERASHLAHNTDGVRKVHNLIGIK